MTISIIDNPYFGAGFGLLGVGAFAAAARQMARIGRLLFRRHFTTSLEITSMQRCYPWLLEYVAQRCTERGTQLAIGLDECSMVPSTGVHVFQHDKRGTWIRVERTREKMVNFASGVPFETMKLSVFGRRQPLFQEMLEDVKMRIAEQNKTNLFVLAPYLNEWRQLGAARRKRSLESVILSDNLQYNLADDIRTFLKSPDWYNDRGVPYRRGYLFHGPPGCGKSSLIYALAGLINHSICILNIAERTLTDDRLVCLLNNVPENCVLVLEDIDHACSNYNDRNDARFVGLNPLSLGGLLNGLDGIVSAEGRLVFMTTNHLERLDSALIRPGRVDVSKEISFATAVQASKMFKKFFPDSTASDLQRFDDAYRHAVSSESTSPARLQSFFMSHRDNSEHAISQISELK